MAAVTQLVEEHVFRYRTEGDDAARGKAERYAGALDKVTGAEDRTSASSDKAARAKERMAAALDRAQRQADADARAYGQMQAAVEAAQQSVQAMADAQMRAAQASDAANRAANDNVRAVQEQGSAFGAAAKFALEHPIITGLALSKSAKFMSGYAATAAASLATASAATARHAAESAAMGSQVAGAASVAARGLGLASTAAAATSTGLGVFAEKTSAATLALSPMTRLLMMAAPLLLPIAAGFAAIVAASAALDKANADLAKLVELGERAEKLDIGAPFLKSFTGIGAQFRIEAEQMEAALQRASGFLRDRYGQASAATRVFGDIDTGGTPLRAQQQLALAQSMEERIRAVLAGMVELEQRGQRLAALNVGEKVFGAEIVERLRQGEGAIARFAAAFDEARGKEVLSQADVARAVELNREIADVKAEIDKAMASTFDFSAAAMKLNEIWLGILKPVRDVTVAIAESVSGGDAATMRRIEDLQARARQIEAVSIPRAVDRGDSAVVASLREQVVGLQGEVDRLSATMTSAAERIDAAVGRVPPPVRVMSEELTALVQAADQAGRQLDGTAASAGNAGAAMGGAALKARDFADALRTIQQANPNLAGTLSLLDRINKVNRDAVEGTRGVKEQFDLGKLSDTEAQEKIRKLNDEATTSIKALRTEAEKPITGYIREADIGAMGQLEQSLARVGDRFAETRQKATDYYDVRIANAAPEARGAIEDEKVAALARLDAAYQKNAATARKAAADRTSAESGGAGADAYDNALQRARDQIKEFELQAKAADKASEEVIRLTEANRLRRAADSAGRSGEAGVAEEIERTAAALAKQKTAADEAVEAHRRLQDGTRALGDEFSRFFDSVLLGSTSLTSAFEGMARSLASSGLQAFLTGQGPLAGLLGTANPQRGEIGGLLGGITPRGFEDLIADGTRRGSEAGTQSGLSFLTEMGGVGGNGRSLLAGAAGLTMVAGSYSIGQQSRGATGLIGGAVSGAIGGAMLGAQIGAVGGPVGAAVGAAVGLIGSWLGQDDARRQRQKEIQAKLQELKDQYQAQKPQIDQFRAGLRGEATSGVEATITAAFGQMVQANRIASQGGDQAAADQMVKEFEGFRQRMRQQFSEAWAGTLAEVQAGLGTNGPFAQAAAAVHALGDALQAFVTDTAGVRGAADVAAARAAAQAAALASLQVAPTLSETEREMARIQGTAAGLRTELVRLGLSSEEAARAIEQGVAQALGTLRERFRTDLAAKINDALGRGYVNEIGDLLREVAQLRTDAAALGLDATQVQAYFVAAAQKIVDQSNLTGDAFADLVRQFPELTGLVHAFSGSLDNAAAAAQRALTYQDRLFAATNDTSTLEGQLAAFDRQANREREQEAAAGGQAMADLEAALYAERLQIVRNYQEQAAQAERQRMEEAQKAFDGFVKSIRTYLDNLKVGPNSTLSPGAQLDAAREAYNRQLALAQGGNRDALDSITQYADSLLQAGRAQFASSAGYQEIFAQIQSQLGALPSQVSPEQFIVDAVKASQVAIVTATQTANADLVAALRTSNPAAIAEALRGQFASLDANVDDLISRDEFLAGLGPLATASEQRAARAVFDRIDADGDGQISKLEVLRYDLVQAVQANRPELVAAALNRNFATLDTSIDGLLSPAEFLAGLGPLATAAEQRQALEVFRRIDADGDGVISALEILRTTLKAAIDAGSAQATAAALLPQFQTLTATTGGLLNFGQFSSLAGGFATQAEQQYARAIFQSIDQDGDGQLSRLELIRASNQRNTDLVEVDTNTGFSSRDALNAIRGLQSTATEQLSFIKPNTDFQNARLADIYSSTSATNTNTFASWQNLKNANARAGAVVYAEGGWVNGPGTATSDSIAARLSNGEFVVNAASARLNAPWLEAMNDNPFAPTLAALPMPIPMPVAGGGGDFAALVAEVRALRAENKSALELVARLTASGAKDQVKATQDVRDEVAGSRDDERRARRNAGGVSGRERSAA